ncbi:DUF2069 domain-containing protein [Salinispirillum sp. LH 10-3-1]|uniref:DUF2069 domain-containing protein n=1 Tax=Salinispirillum sp. LH 10-3-1 TaxID=2952525 RepID=A0AB38YJL6_9GAMM
MMSITQQQKWLRVTWASYIALVLMYAVQTWVTAPSGVGTPFEVIGAGMALWFLKTLPLWLFCPALIRLNARQLSWFGFVTLLYIPFTIVAAFDEPRWIGLLMSVASMGLFLGNAYLVRALKRGL